MTTVMLTITTTNKTPRQTIKTAQRSDFFLNNQPDALIIPILFCYKTLDLNLPGRRELEE
jgi:hypothetical protein